MLIAPIGVVSMMIGQSSNFAEVMVNEISYRLLQSDSSFSGTPNQSLEPMRLSPRRSSLRLRSYFEGCCRCQAGAAARHSSTVTG